MLVFLKPERLGAPAWPSAHAQARDPKTMSASSVVVGIDVAKAHVDVAVYSTHIQSRFFRFFDETIMFFGAWSDDTGNFLWGPERSNVGQRVMNIT